MNNQDVKQVCESLMEAVILPGKFTYECQFCSNYMHKKDRSMQFAIENLEHYESCPVTKAQKLLSEIAP